MEFCNVKNNRQIPELDAHIPQGIEKFEDKSRETDEIVDDYVPPCHDVDNSLSSVKRSTRKTADYPANERSSIVKAKHCLSNNCMYKITLRHENNWMM